MTREDPATENRVVRVGNYRFTGKTLGKGSFATVEEAVHIRLKVKVSVKNINLLKCNAYVLKHLKREASVLHQLAHPNILRLFETMMYGNYYCLVAEIVRGGNLCSYVQQQRNKQLDEKTNRKLSRQITSALGYLHGKGIVHRDLKLENIMLDSRKENIKLVDFGLSNSWESESPLKTLCGSPEYSAPELFVTGTNYGPEVDMWALGVVIYAMAVGRLPFPDASSLMRTQEKRTKFLTSINSGLSKHHINIITGYSPEFISLLHGLVNPQSDERLTVKEALADPWLSNNNRWSTAQYDSLDAYDLGKVSRKVCCLLDITDDCLRNELQNRPFGEVAGVYNIMVHEQSRPKMEDTINFVTRRSCKSSSLIDTFNQRYGQGHHDNNSSNYKICVVGATHKLNEVVKGRKPTPQSFYTSTTSSSERTSQRSCDSRKIYNSDINMAGGDCSSIPRIGPFKGIKANFPHDTVPCKQSQELMTSRYRFKERSKILHQPILPSKLKLKSPMCKVIADVQQSGTKG
uniref:Protein kinase domain-containing protein n=1 Tax=Cuerna arida TaxID=1464854 RepID=A0A1B6F977_9HEMI